MFGLSAQAAGQDRIYWVQDVVSPAVQRSDLTGAGVQTTWTGQIEDIVLDHATQTMYWSVPSGGIYKGAMDGTGSATLVVALAPGFRADKLALDSRAQVLYFGDRTNVQITMLNLGTGATTVLPITFGPVLRDIALDTRSGKGHLYICDGTRMHRTDLTGRNQVTLPNPVGPDVYGIAIDTCNEKLFMVGKTDPRPGVPVHFVSTANLADASGLTRLLSTPAVGLEPWEIALDVPRGHMYWTARDGAPTPRPLLGKANLDGTSPQFLATGAASSRYRAIALDIEQTTCCVPPPANMVLWTTFDETSGNLAGNVVGPFDGVVVGSTAEPGKVRDGQLCRRGNSVTVADYPAVNPGVGDFSIDAWVRTDPGSGSPCGRSGTTGTIVRKFNVLGGPGYHFYLNNSGTPCADRLELLIDDGASQQIFTTTAAVPLNQWAHVAVTVQRGAPSTVTFYVNGVASPGVPSGPTVLGSLANVEPVEIGSNPSLSGSIDEVEIFRRVLKPEEVASLVNADSTGKCKEFCLVDWDRSFYDAQAFLDVPAQICNNTAAAQTYNLSIQPLACEHTSTPSPTGVTFSPASPVTVPPGGCITVWLRIPRPPLTRIGDLSCYNLCMTNIDTGNTHCCMGSVQWSPGVEILRADFASAMLVTGVPLDFDFVVASLGAPVVVPFRVSAIGPDMLGDISAIGFDGADPGVAVEGVISLPAGGEDVLSFQAMFTVDDPGRGYAILIEMDLDGDGSFEPMESLSVMNALEDPCPPVFVEDFEFYMPESEPCGIGGWSPWPGSTDVCGLVTTDQAASGMRSLRIDGQMGGMTGQGDDMVRTFDLTSGRHVLTMQTLVPTGATGRGWVVMLSEFPAPFNWALNLMLDANAGIIRDEQDAGLNTPLVFGQWIELQVVIDLDADTVDATYNGVPFIVGKSWTLGVPPSGPATFKALDLYADEPGTGTSGMYFDDISLRTLCEPTPEPCVADCDASGALDLFDFLCFQNQFDAGDPRADLDGDGQLTIFDFLAFQNAFDAGCP
ncbi:MAG: LamG-like jellyroll fold domain-containing protein [Phycisphaerales bacterium JB064]